ncbi:MAG: hypothetical protein WEG36_12410 [Gemmatimonadota bacterium]
MEIDLKEERRRSRERTGEVVLDARGPELVLAEERAHAAEGYVQGLRSKLLGTETPLRRQADGSGGVWVGASPIDEALKQLALATGFLHSDVRDWVVYGERPRLHRAIIGIREHHENLPDGTVLRHRCATLTLHAPITEREIRRIHREHLRDAWSEGTDPISALTLKGPDVSELDYHLLRLRQKNREAAWSEILKLWRRTPPTGHDPGEWKRRHAKVSVEALKVRWHRIPEEVRDQFTAEEETHDS